MNIHCILIDSCFSISGCTDHFAGTESDGLAIIRRIIANLNMKKNSLQTSGTYVVVHCGVYRYVCWLLMSLVPADSPRLSHSLEDFAALIPHDNPHQLPIMEVCMSVCYNHQYISL